MRKITAIALCLCLLISACISFAACANDDKKNESTTPAQTEASKNETPTTEPEGDTDDVVETEVNTNDEPDTDGQTDDEDDPAPIEGAISIKTVEDLINLNKMVNDDYEDLSDCTISIDADINCKSIENWKPLEIYADNLTILGNDHKITNLTIIAEDGVKNNGFIGFFNGENLLIKDLHLMDFKMEVYGAQAAALIGYIDAGSIVEIDNCEVYNLEINGYMDNYSEGHKNIGFRISGFVGGNFGGYVTIKNCVAETFKLCGFHNLSAFVGYDMADGVTLLDSSATDIDITFSYTEAPGYTITNDHRTTSTDGTFNGVFVDPFYNSSKWEDHLQRDLDNGNTYNSVVYHDHEDPNAPAYDPDHLRSGLYDYDYNYIKAEKK